MPVFSQFIPDFFHLLFPEYCNACGTQLVRGEKQLCIKCRYDLPYTDFHLYTANAVAKLFWGRLHCNAAMAMLYFRKGSRVQHLIHRLKYKDQTGLGFTLGKMLGERLAQSPAYHHADLIIPVPLHPGRERNRGYNQSKCIADGMTASLHIPVGTTQLIRQKATGTQTRKSRYDRFENMRSVFHVPDAASLAGKHIILVDDVITTGATLEACGQVLL
ncbi:MAG TPA: phosphoribosyltransferase family protein, partial [Pedobacter sp.]